MEYELNPWQWFLTRELTHKPKHFVLAKTPVTDDSYNWIVHALKGRFSIEGRRYDDGFLSLPIVLDQTIPAFEDPMEAVLYELRWS